MARKVTREEAQSILDMIREGVTYKEISRITGRDKDTIARIRKREAFPDLDYTGIPEYVYKPQPALRGKSRGVYLPTEEEIERGKREIRMAKGDWCEEAA